MHCQLSWNFRHRSVALLTLTRYPTRCATYSLRSSLEFSAQKCCSVSTHSRGIPHDARRIPCAVQLHGCVLELPREDVALSVQPSAWRTESLVEGRPGCLDRHRLAHMAVPVQCRSRCRCQCQCHSQSHSQSQSQSVSERKWGRGNGW